MISAPASVSCSWMTSTSSGATPAFSNAALRRVHRRRDVLLDRREGGVDLVRAVAAGTHLDRPQIHRLRGVAMRDVGAAHHDRRRALVGRAEHVLGQRVVQHRRVEDLLLGDRLAPERIRVQRAVAEVLGRHLGQRFLRDAVVVQVAVGLHPEELGGEVLPVLGVPARHAHQCGILGEGATRVLVQADGDADVVVAQPDSVGTCLRGTGRRRAGVEHVGERDARQSDHADDRVRVGHRPAAAGGELDVFPLDAGVGDGGEDGVDAHLHGRLAFESTERMQAYADDRDVVRHVRDPL